MRSVVGVAPPAAAAARSRLLSGLERLFPVTFTPRELDEHRGLDAVVTFAPASATLPIPHLELVAPPRTSTSRSSVVVARTPAVDARLRGRTLEENHVPDGEVSADGEVLATRAGRPVWVRRPHGGFAVACAPDELADREPLKHHLRAGRFFGLVSLVEFLRGLSSGDGWTPRPRHALIMFDDPNLHWTSYGHLSYADVARHAEEHGYHAAMATIPIDAAFFHARTAALFRARASQLSLLIHGIHHEYSELMRPLGEPERAAAIARALRWIEGLERRAKVRVSRAMTAPHGVASAEYIGTMFRSGLEALFADNPSPWRGQDAHEGSVEAQWWPVTFVRGLPLIPRYLLTEPWEELVFRAYLDHPLVIYGHHVDVAEGLDVLARVVELTNSLGGYTWLPAHEIARANVSTRARDDATLAVRLFARCVTLDVPPTVERLVISLPHGGLGLDSAYVAVDGAIVATLTSRPGEPASLVIATRPGPRRIELRPVDSLDLPSIKPSRVRPWPVARRAMTETRDRLLPLIRE